MDTEEEKMEIMFISFMKNFFDFSSHQLVEKDEAGNGINGIGLMLRDAEELFHGSSTDTPMFNYVIFDADNAQFLCYDIDDTRVDKNNYYAYILEKNYYAYILENNVPPVHNFPLCT
jgi:hypothetical protein